MSKPVRSVPKCVSETFPDGVAKNLKCPPTRDELINGLEALLDDYNYISLRTFGKYTETDIKKTPLLKYMDALYDLVYYRECNLEKVSIDGCLLEFVQECWSVDLTTAIEGLFWLVQSVRYQTQTKAAEGLLTTSTYSVQAAVHFIQMAHVQLRLEFANEGIFKPDTYLANKLKEKGESYALFTPQEAAFVANVSGQSISNELRDGGMLKKVSATHVIHWSEFSEIPDYLNPRKGNEVGNKQAFITHHALQSWLARKPGFKPTQFLFNTQIPRYTDNNLFKIMYLSTINKLKISDKELISRTHINPTQLKWLKKGTRGMYFRQALELDNFIHEKVTGKNERQRSSCFPFYHSILEGI